jgi:glucose/arabinose dehydrogenase
MFLPTGKNLHAGRYTKRSVVPKRLLWGATIMLAAALACTSETIDGPNRVAPSATPTPAGPLIPEDVRVRVYADGLSKAVDMAWVPGTARMFVTEQKGAIRIVDRERVRATPCAVVSPANVLNGGLLGIALDPDFKTNHYLYVYYTKDSPRENRVSRFEVVGNSCIDETDIVTGLEVGKADQGGQLLFHNGYLLVSVGSQKGAPAQDPSNRLGKILRYNPDGSVPPDGPFSVPGAPNPVWTMGHRNAFGLALGPGGRIYETENGPHCDDELNLLEPGVNYGWGEGKRCGGEGIGEDPRPALITWPETIVPTDLWWYTGPLQSLAGDLYMGNIFNGLHRIRLDGSGTKVVSDTVIYEIPGGVVSVIEGPERFLYFLTREKLFRFEPAAG